VVRASSQFADVTAGVVYIHSSPAALCPHIEWALTSALAAPAKLRWTAQPVDGHLRATSEWIGPVGTAARIAQGLAVLAGAAFRGHRGPQRRRRR